MTYETRPTTALVAGTLGMATLAAVVAVISASVSFADEPTPKILDRLSDVTPAMADAGSKIRVIEIRNETGTVVYRNDPASAETVVAAGMPASTAGVPVPMARAEALMSVGPSLASLPQARPSEMAAVRLPLPRPELAPRVAAYVLPLPKPSAAEVKTASLARPTSESAFRTE